MHKSQPIPEPRAISGEYALTSCDGRILAAGEEFAAWLGRTVEELSDGATLQGLCDEASAPLLHAQFAWFSLEEDPGEGAGGHPPATGHVRLRAAGGKLVPVEFFCVPLDAAPGRQPGGQPDGKPSLGRAAEPGSRPLVRFLFKPGAAEDLAEQQQGNASSVEFPLLPLLPRSVTQEDDSWTADQVHARYLLATIASTEGLWDWDQTQERTYYSARWQSILGLPDEEITASPDHFLCRIHEKDKERFLACCQGQSGLPEDPFEVELRMLHADGGWRWIQVHGISVAAAVDSAGVEDSGGMDASSASAAKELRRSQQGRPARIVGTISDVTRHRILDPLTGLHNRFALIDRLERRLEMAAHEPRPFAVLFVDIDAFKRINDSFSHWHGDSVLVEMGRRIGSTLASDSTSFGARLGGDEFVVVLDNMAEEDVAMYTHALQTLLQVPVRCGEQQLFLTASIGVAMSTAGYLQAEDMLQDADMAMFRAKAGGKAKSCFFTRSMREKIRERMQVEVELRRGLQANELLLHYQPKVLLQTGEITGFEALVRWNHPTLGLLGPGSFIPIAEDTDLILAIGRWTMLEAIRQVSAWRRAGILPPHATMSVNLSARQFADYGLVNAIRNALSAENLRACYLDIEVTESALIDDTATALSTLQELKGIGVGLELDDFGMGYSSLSYLHRFPFDTLKVDRSFVTNLGETDESTAIARSVIALGAALRMKVLAEGIETAEQAERLLELGCRYGQGYYFSRPLPASECVRLMLTHAKGGSTRGPGQPRKPVFAINGPAGEQPPLASLAARGA